MNDTVEPWPDRVIVTKYQSGAAYFTSQRVPPNVARSLIHSMLRVHHVRKHDADAWIASLLLDVPISHRNGCGVLVATPPTRRAQLRDLRAQRIGPGLYRLPEFLIERRRAGQWCVWHLQRNALQRPPLAWLDTLDDALDWVAGGSS